MFDVLLVHVTMPGSTLKSMWLKPHIVLSKVEFCLQSKKIKFGRNNFICSNHFQYGRPTGISPISTLYLKWYDHESEGEAVKRKSPAKRHPILEKPRNKRKIIHSSTISNKQIYEPIFNFEVSIDLPTFTSFNIFEIQRNIIVVYRISSNKRPGAYKIFSKIAWAFIRGGAYLKFPKMS